MDKLFMHDFNVQLVIGAYEWERNTPQTVRLDLEIGLPDNRAGLTDHIQDAINYAEVAERIRLLVAQSQFHLIEALAEQIAQLVRQDFKAPWVRVSVTKPAVVRGIARLGVTIERGSLEFSQL